MRVAGKDGYAHRAFYERERGAIMSDMQIDHLCRVRACVNPAHLEAVPQATNLRRGNGTKLSKAGAVAIKRLFDEGGYTRRELSEMFGVSRTVVYNVTVGNHWTLTDRLSA